MAQSHSYPKSFLAERMANDGRQSGFSRRSPSPAHSASVESSSDAEDGPASKKARAGHGEEDDDDAESAEDSSHADDDADVVRQKVVAEEDRSEGMSKDEGDAASETGSTSESIGSDRTITENNAGVLSCEVTIRTGDKPSDVSASPAAIIVVAPSN